MPSLLMRKIKILQMIQKNLILGNKTDREETRFCVVRKGVKSLHFLLKSESTIQLFLLSLIAQNT
jgi:hypothetical protein